MYGFVRILVLKECCTVIKFISKLNLLTFIKLYKVMIVSCKFELKVSSILFEHSRSVLL